MERLWAPWRIEYILNEKPDSCVFCLSDDKANDSEKYVLHRTRHSFVILNRYPYTNGHLLVAPLRHISDITDLTDEEMLDLFSTVRLSRNILQKAASPQGYNVGINLGKAAGAGVDQHLHVHIVPRWNGDTNFMTVMTDIRVMPENLRTTYERLAELFDATAALED